MNSQVKGDMKRPVVGKIQPRRQLDAWHALKALKSLQPRTCFIGAWFCMSWLTTWVALLALPPSFCLKLRSSHINLAFELRCMLLVSVAFLHPV